MSDSGTYFFFVLNTAFQVAIFHPVVIFYYFITQLFLISFFTIFSFCTRILHVLYYYFNP